MIIFRRMGQNRKK